MSRTQPLRAGLRPMTIILLIIFALLLFAVLELGKHTLAGWILAIIALAGFIFLRARFWADKPLSYRLLSWLALIAVSACILLISRPPVKAVPAVIGKNGGITDVIHTKQGDVTGILTADGQVEVYAGIPYAKPPVGELRWKEPVPAEPWDGVLAADHFAPMAMQTQNHPIMSSLTQIIGFHDYKISLSDNSVQPASEDALYLNIWKPQGDVSGLPVLVYVHGGSLQTGQPWYQDYSGNGLAREGVVVVNMGYRLGIFGFFADEELAAESPNGTTGNYGLLDQILALQWVQDNIEAFGGDPSNVTLAGESAGSACVSALCTSPLAKGLFTRVVGESSTVTAPVPAHSFRSYEDALAAAEETKARFGASTIAELRALPAEKIVDEMNRHHHITIDGYVLPETPWESYAKGIHNESAQLQGFNRDEAAPFIMFSKANLKNYEEKVRNIFESPYAERVLALYPASNDQEAADAWEKIENAVLFSYGHYCWERQAAAAGIPAYLYYFTKENGRLGPWHSGEEVYLYGNIPENSSLYDEGDRKLSRAMMLSFRNFIATGDPNLNPDGSTSSAQSVDSTDRAGAALMPRWEPAQGADTLLEFGSVIRYVDAPYLELYEILDEMYGVEFGK